MRGAGSSDSDSDGSGRRIPIEAAYKSLRLSHGLSSADTYCTAVEELTAICGSCYKGRTFTKEAQRLLEDDVRQAIQTLPRSEPGKRALHRLMQAVERTLPQTKRNTLLREYKQAVVHASRAERRQGQAQSGARCDPSLGSSSSDAQDDDAAMHLVHLPRECVDAILQHLGPRALAMAACTCREWRAAVAADALWLPLLGRTFGSLVNINAEQPIGSSPRDVTSLQPSGHENKTTIAAHAICAADSAPEGGTTSSSTRAEAAGRVQRRFAELAAQIPHRLLPWCCHRVAFPSLGSVRWMTPETRRRLLQPPSTALSLPRESRAPSIVFLSPDQVVVWLDRRTKATLLQFAASAREEQERAVAAVQQQQQRHRAGGGGRRAAAAGAAGKGGLRFWAVVHP